MKELWVGGGHRKEAVDVELAGNGRKVDNTILPATRS